MGRKRRSKYQMQLHRAVALDSARHQFQACLESLKRQAFAVITARGELTVTPVSELKKKVIPEIPTVSIKRRVGRPLKVPSIAITPTQPKLSKTARVLKMVMAGASTAKIRNALKVTSQFVYSVRWYAKKKKVLNIKRGPGRPKKNAVIVRTKDMTNVAKLHRKLGKHPATSKVLVEVPDTVPKDVLNGKHKPVNRIHKILVKAGR